MFTNKRTSKKITVINSLAYAISITIFVSIALMLYTACAKLQERTNEKNFFDELEKPLLPSFEISRQ